MRSRVRTRTHGSVRGRGAASPPPSYSIRELRVGITGLCADVGSISSATPHEVFVHLGPGYYNTRRKIFSAGTQPLVRVKPAIPMLYESRGWDFGWLMPRSDGYVARWLCDPYTLEFKKSEGRHPIRWFAR